MKKLIAALLALAPVAADAACINLYLGQNWTFYLQGSRFSTGAEYDATGTPAYRLYEEETGTPILTGSFALLDDAGTVGLYSEQIAATGANGFEVGKCYVVRKTATVDSVSAASIDCACISLATDTSGYVALATDAIGAAQIATDAIGAAEVAASAIGASELATDAIGADEVAADAIGSSELAANSITSSEVADDSIDAGAIAADSIGASEIASGAIAAAEVADGAIDALTFAAGAIDASAIATDAIGAAEIAASAIALGTEATGWDDLDAAGVRSAVGLASANLDTQLSAIDDYVDSEVAAILAASRLASGTSDSGSTTTLVDAARTEADTDYWRWAWVCATSGNLAGQCGVVTAFDAGTDTLTLYPAFTQAWSTQDYQVLPAAPVNLARWLGTAPNALASGRVDSTVGAMQANTMTASALATDAVNEIVDQAWEETLADHSGTSGSTAAALNAAGAAGDPWSTAIPGAYGAGTAGYIVGNNVNATISSRSSHSAADVWTSGTRTLTAIDEDSTTLDLNATYVGGVTVLDEDLTTVDLNATTIGTVTTLTGHTPQTGDSFARLGAPAGASVSADIAAVKAETASILTDTSAYDTDAEHAAALWNAATATYGSAGSYGALLETNLDAAVSSVSGGSSPQLMQTTTLATVSTQTSMTLTAGSADNDAYNDAVAVFVDQSTSTQKAQVLITDYVGSTKTITLAEAPAFTVAVGDTINIVAVGQPWDAVIADHAISGSTGSKLSSAASAGDPWSTTLPGAYASGTAGYLLGTHAPSINTILGLVAGPITITPPLTLNAGKLTLRVGVDYYNADGLAPVFTCTSSSCPVLTGATVTLRLKPSNLTVTGTIDDATSATRIVHVDIPRTTTTQLTPGVSTYDVKVTLASGNIIAPWAGVLEVKAAP